MREPRSVSSHMFTSFFWYDGSGGQKAIWLTVLLAICPMVMETGQRGCPPASGEERKSLMMEWRPSGGDTLPAIGVLCSSLAAARRLLIAELFTGCDGVPKSVRDGHEVGGGGPRDEGG